VIRLPGREEHEILAWLLVGDKCSAIHELMDWPQRLYGKDHRQFNHDPLSVLMLSMLTDDPITNFLGGLVHIMQDKERTRLKRVIRGVG